MIVSYQFATRCYLRVPAVQIYIHLYIFTRVCPFIKLVMNFEVNLKIVGFLSHKMMMQTCTGGKNNLLVFEARVASLILWMLEERVELASVIVFSSAFLSVQVPSFPICF